MLKQTCRLLGEDLQKLLAGGCGTTLQLQGLKVVAAGQTLIECTDEVEAVVALCLSHSIFNVKFNRNISALMAYVRTYVLVIDDGIKPPQRCLRFVQQLS